MSTEGDRESATDEPKSNENWTVLKCAKCGCMKVNFLKVSKGSITVQCKDCKHEWSVAGEPLPESKERYYLGVMKRPSVRVQRLARPEPEREYEPYGDEWRKELMKCPKSMLIDILKTVCMRNRSLFGPDYEYEGANNEYDNKRTEDVQPTPGSQQDDGASSGNTEGH